jgi:hypothetical protein
MKGRMTFLALALPSVLAFSLWLATPGYSDRATMLPSKVAAEVTLAVVDTNTTNPPTTASPSDLVLADNVPKSSAQNIIQAAESTIMTTTKSKPWEGIILAPLKLTNNVWGAPADESLTSTIYLNENHSFGWYWQRLEPKMKDGVNCVQPIYPGVRVGGSPWEASTSKYFPIKLGDIKTLVFNVTFSYPEAPSGLNNLAYDIFFTETDKANTNPEIKAEVMIWLHGSNKQPPNTYKGDFTDGYHTYQLYSWVMSNGRAYYSFIMTGGSPSQGQHTVDARKLLDNLELDPGWYIHGVELGNEIWHGTGKIEISKLSINVNGNEAAGY